jgi:O-Antigen ligase
MIFLICVVAFIVSGDIFFVIPVGGFTLRIFQVLMVPVLLKGLWDLFGRSVWPVGFGSLLLWTAFILCFVPNSSLLDRNLFYALWLVFSVLMVLGVTSCIDTPEKLQKVLRYYVYSYGFSAAFGVSQFLLPLVGLHPFLVQQWWFPDVLARINGFTYEPSYFATYMIAGWVMIDYLRYKKSDLPHLDFIYWLVTAALLLSSSRIGWATMMAWWALRAFWHWREGVLPLRKIALTGVVGGSLILVAALSFGLHAEDLTFLTNGLGLLESSGSHSSQGRWDAAMQTLRVYADHPIIGVSLGGVAPEIARQNHIAVADNDDAKANEGLCTTAEVLAASGTIGFVFYLLYMSKLCSAVFQSEERTLLVAALGWGLIFQLIVLQTDQNILRGYLWFHISLLSAAFAVLRTAPNAAVQPLLTATNVSGIHR